MNRVARESSSWWLYLAEEKLQQLKTDMELRGFVLKFIHNTDKNVIMLFAFFFFKVWLQSEPKCVREGGDSVP